MNKEKLRNDTFAIIGFTLAQIQSTEAVIEQCWLLHAEKRKGEGLIVKQDIEAILTQNKKKTLGVFLREVKKSTQFSKGFETRFERFVDNRNRLIHRIFKEKQYRSFNNKRMLARLNRFAGKLFHEANYFEKVFDAYLGMMYLLACESESFDIKDKEGLRRIVDGKYKRGEMQELRKHIHLTTA